MLSFVFLVGLLGPFICTVSAQYSDTRCKCVCPSPNVIPNGTDNKRSLYTEDVNKPNDCNCKQVVLKHIVPEYLPDEKKDQFCPRCECRYESRNTTTIKVVVILIICIISMLVVYMLFLMCLDPFLNKRVTGYQEHTDEEVNLDEPTHSTTTTHPPLQRSGSVMNRVGIQQNKWKRQVQEQRRNIYDRHTMLN